MTLTAARRLCLRSFLDFVSAERHTQASCLWKTRERNISRFEDATISTFANELQEVEFWKVKVIAPELLGDCSLLLLRDANSLDFLLSYDVRIGWVRQDLGLDGRHHGEYKADVE